MLVLLTCTVPAREVRVAGSEPINEFGCTQLNGFLVSQLLRGVSGGGDHLRREGCCIGLPQRLLSLYAGFDLLGQCTWPPEDGCLAQVNVAGDVSSVPSGGTPDWPNGGSCPHRGRDRPGEPSRALCLATQSVPVVNVRASHSRRECGCVIEKVST